MQGGTTKRLSITNMMKAPVAIGGTTPAAGAFTTLSATGAVTATGAIAANGGITFVTSDPHVAGVWWDNAGALTKSAG